MRVVAVLVVAVALVIGVAAQFTHCKTGSIMSANAFTATPPAGTATGAGPVATAKATPIAAGRAAGVADLHHSG